MQNRILIGVLVVLIIVGTVGGAVGGLSLASTKTVTSTATATDTVTQTATGTGTTATVTKSTTSTTSSCTTSTPSTLTTVNVGITAVNAGEDEYYTAAALGYFTQQGLNVNTEVLGTTPLTDALVTGAVDFSPTALSYSLAADAAGEPLVNVMSLTQGLQTISIIVAPNSGITSVSQLNGMKIGSISAPSSLYYVAIEFAKYYGITWTQITYGTDTPMVSAFLSGQIAAIVAVQPSVSEPLVQAGEARMLVGPQSMGGTLTPSVWAEFLNASGYSVPAGSQQDQVVLIVSNNMLNNHPNVVQEFVNAMQEAMYWIANVAHDNGTLITQTDYGWSGLSSTGYNESIFLDDEPIYAQSIALPSHTAITTASWTDDMEWAVVTDNLNNGNVTQLSSASSFNSLVNNKFVDNAQACWG